LERLNEAESLKKEDDRLELLITSVIEEKKPDSVDQLVKLVAAEGFSEEKIVKQISRLERLGRIGLESDKLETVALRKRLFSYSAFWYWGVIVFCLAAVFSVLAIPSDLIPFVYIRWMFGLVLLLYVPGFCLVRSLFPKKEIMNIEVVIWNLCFSLIMVLLVALFWNFTPLGLSEMPIAVTLAVLSVLLASVAVLRNTNANHTDKG
jgi:hypothetical protein